MQLLDPWILVKEVNMGTLLYFCDLRGPPSPSTDPRSRNCTLDAQKSMFSFRLAITKKESQILTLCNHCTKFFFFNLATKYLTEKFGLNFKAIILIDRNGSLSSCCWKISFLTSGWQTNRFGEKEIGDKVGKRKWEEEGVRMSSIWKEESDRVGGREREMIKRERERGVLC